MFDSCKTFLNVRCHLKRIYLSPVYIYMYIGVLQLWSGFFSQNHMSQAPLVPVIEDLLTSAEFIQSDTPMVWLRRALILSEEIIKVTALATKGQRKNPM